MSQDSDRSSEDWDGTKAKAREQSKSLIDFHDSKPQTNTEQTTDIDQVAFSKLQIRQGDPREEPLEVMKSLIPPLPATESTRRSDRKHQQRRAIGSREIGFRGKKKSTNYMTQYRIYMGQLSV